MKRRSLGCFNDGRDVDVLVEEFMESCFPPSLLETAATKWHWIGQKFFLLLREDVLENNKWNPLFLLHFFFDRVWRGIFVPKILSSIASMKCIKILFNKFFKWARVLGRNKIHIGLYRALVLGHNKNSYWAHFNLSWTYLISPLII